MKLGFVCFNLLAPLNFSVLYEFIHVDYTLIVSNYHKLYDIENKNTI